MYFIFCVEKMGVVYIKFGPNAKAMQNVEIYLQKKIENLHLKFVTIANPISFKKSKTNRKEYGCPLNKKSLKKYWKHL